MAVKSKKKTEPEREKNIGLVKKFTKNKKK
jgi:hypothetical protein